MILEGFHVQSKPISMGGATSPDNVNMRHLDGKCDKVALHTGRDVEGASCGVHAGAVLGVGDLLQDNFDLVKPAPVVNALPD